jgi:hypothetical protein
MKHSSNEAHGTLPQLKLSVKQQEIICSLELREETLAAAYQRKLALNLSDTYENGAIDVASDKWKSRHFKRIGQKKAEKLPLARTEIFYQAEGWFQGINAFLNHILNVLNIVGIFALNILTSTLQTLGFTRAVMLLFDLSLVFKSLLFPTGSVEKQLSYWLRFKNILNKDQRLFRICNNIVWLSFIIAAFFLTGGMSAIVAFAFHLFANLSGPVINAIHILTKRYDIDSHTKLLHKLTQELHAIRDQKAVLSNELSGIEEEIKVLRTYTNMYSTFELKDRMARLEEVRNSIEKDIMDLEPIETMFKTLTTSVKKVIYNLRSHFALSLLSVATVITGVCLLMFAPVIPLMVAGACFVLVGGSFFDGIGKKVYLSLKERFSKKPTVCPDEDDTLSTTATLYKNLGKISEETMGLDADTSAAVVYSMWEKKPEAATPLSLPHVFMGMTA